MCIRDRRKPERDDHTLSEAAAELTTFRDAIIAEQRRGGIRSAEERGTSRISMRC